MPKYFCEYCGIYLTHSSPGGRYQHSHGRKHINNKIEYYSQFLTDFQQNTFNNLLTLATKFNKPKSNDNFEEQDIEINIEKKEENENLENNENNDKEKLNEIKEEDENNKSDDNDNNESNK